MLRSKCCWNLQKVGHPTFRATTPLSRGILKSKGRGKLSIHFAADYFTIDTIFRIILSVNQLSVYGAVANMCEEFESHPDRSGEPEILMGQSIVLGDIKAEVPSQNEDSMNDQIIWQQYIQQIESLSLESKVSRFCKEAGFIHVVEIGQYFMTKDTEEQKHENWACIRSHDQFSTLQIWNRNSNLVCESRHSQSWVRISYGTTKYVVESIQDNTEILSIHKKSKYHKQASRLLQPDQRQKQDHNRGVLVGTTATIPMHERRWIDI